jgi:regulator of RNase E activity RraA
MAVTTEFNVTTDPVLDAFRDLATPTLANALDDIGFDGVMRGIGQVVPGTRAVGRAVTVQQVSGARGDFKSEDFKVGHMIDAAAPGTVLVIANGGREVSTWGGLATLAAKVKGLGGLVVDGGVRDREEMLEHKLPIFTRHMTPLTGRTRIKIVSMGDVVTCGGVRVCQGDIIVADGSGVVCIPQADASRIAELANRYAADDKRAEADIASGLTFKDAMAKFTRI